MMDWNKEPRSVVERAAAKGDEGAIACLRLHQRLDGVDSAVDGLRIELTGFNERLTSQINDLRQKIVSRRE